MDLEQKLALKSSLIERGIEDKSVLEALFSVPRESFLSQLFQARAYEDTALPIEHGQTLSQPFIVALMTQSLGVGKRHRVLEIGTGSGYQAAVLARLCRRVYSIERHAPLLKTAEKRFESLAIGNVTTLLGDGFLGWPRLAPFDRIIVTAAPSEMPTKLLDQLAIGGGMVIPLGGEKSSQQLIRVTRTERRFEEKVITPVRFVPMIQGLA